MRPSSYAQIADMCDISLCTGCAQRGHTSGWADPSRGVIHWEERAVNHMGIRNFLKLVAAVVLSHNRGQPAWQRIYEANAFAYMKAKDMGIRLPAHLSAYDRARVEDLMSRAGERNKIILSWARRRDGV